MKFLTLLLVASAAWGAGRPALQGEKAIAALKRSGSYDSLQDAFRAARHQASPKGAGFQFENPENQLDAEFTPAGINVSHPEGQFQLRLESYGYDGALRIPVEASAHGKGNRIEYRRGPLTEWYVNDERGLEQGFTLASRPGEASSGPLILELSVAGDLDCSVESDGILLKRNGHGVIRYTGLEAWDAAGRRLSSHMETRANRVQLIVEDDGASYPIVIDPWLQQAALTASDGAVGDYFGYSVSVSGDTVVVGAPHNASQQGAAYVFVRNGAAWGQQQKLTASDGAAGDAFGGSVSLSGDTVLVGAPGKASGQGVAYVFVRNGTAWSQQQKLTALDGAAGDSLGHSVALSGDTAVAGASYKASQQGAAYVFIRNGAIWSQQQKLTAPDGAAGDDFGYSVSVSNDTVVVGSYGTGNFQGAAYVFIRIGATWSQQQKLTVSGGTTNGGFGFSVAVSGDTVVAGASYEGAAYVFVRSGTTWSQQQKLTASDGLVGDFFGWSVAVSGQTVVVGAPYKGGHRGTAYVFLRSGTAWIQQQQLIASDGAFDNYFGTSVSVNGETTVVGAYYGANFQGAAYTFLSDGIYWSQRQIVSASDGAAYESFASSVAVSGDTAVVGAPNDASYQGAAYVFIRTGTTWSQQQKLTALDGGANAFFGWAVAVSGDTVVVGGDRRFYDQGAAYVFVRNGTTWSQQQRLTAADGATFDKFGFSVSVSGDTAIIGAQGKGNYQGAAYIFVRNATTWSQQQKLTAADATTNDYFGLSVAVSGDTVVAGAPYKSNSQGAAYVFVRTGTIWSQQQKLTASDSAANDDFGYSVAVSGDTVVAGAFYKAFGQGAAYVFVRTGATWSEQQKLTAVGGAIFDSFGYSVALSGDTLAVGAQTVANNQGAAYVFVRSGTNWSQQKITASDGATYDYFGSSVAVSGSAVVVGAYGKASQQGAVYMFQPAYRLITAASPPAGGSVSPISGTYYEPGTIVPLQATPAAGSIFGNWTGPVASPSSGSTTVTMNGPVTATAYFGTPIQITVNTNPMGVPFAVDNIAYVTPQTFNWVTGAPHQISVAAIQPGAPGTRYVWINWSDGQAVSHTVTPSASTTFTANFKTQYQLTMNAGVGGNVSPTTGFFDASSSVPVSAIANPGFAFSNWSGSGNGSFTGVSNPVSVTMNAPLTETATFTSTSAFSARLNAGGTAYNDPLNNLWSPDPSIAGTFTFLTQNPIRNTGSPYLYQSERFSVGTPFQYTFPSVPNGAYNVRLLFAETYFTQPGQRKFHVNINGNPALTNFDIAATAGGSNTAIDTLHSVNVTNGQITIQFVPVLSNPKISAIEITPQTTAIAIAPALSDPLAPGATQQFTPTVIGNVNQTVTYSLSPNIGTISPAGLYTAAAVANPTKVILTATSQADNTKSASATIQLVPQAWSTLDIGMPPVPGTSTYNGNAFNLQGAGDPFSIYDSLRFTFNKLTGDGSIVARVNQPFTGQTYNKSGVMMRSDLTPASPEALTSLFSSIVGLFHWRAVPGGDTNAQFGAAGVPWVRLSRTGNVVSSYISNDASAWIPIGAPQTLSSAGANVGLMASNGNFATLNAVAFDNIELSTSPVAVSINEGLSSLAAGQQAQFTANVTGTPNPAVTWSLAPVGQGSIDPATGLYTAPSVINPSPQTVTITATSVADPTRSASVIVYLGAFQPIRVNCGGPSHYDPTGTFWYGDLGAVGGQGNVYSSGSTIANTQTPYLYQSERFIANSTLAYKYYVPNGTYNVTLKFAEIYFTTAGNRVMNVSINGTTVLPNFDIVAQAGPNTATDRTFPVTVSTGSITISLAPAVPGHTPKINAIQIQ